MQSLQRLMKIYHAILIFSCSLTLMVESENEYLIHDQCDGDSIPCVKENGGLQGGAQSASTHSQSTSLVNYEEAQALSKKSCHTIQGMVVKYAVRKTMQSAEERLKERDAFKRTRRMMFRLGYSNSHF